MPSRQTVGEILNRLGYRLRRVLKARPEKKISRDQRHLRQRPRATSDGRPRRRDAENLTGHKGRAWWSERRALYPEVRRPHVELDNGPEINSSRTQFMKRMVDLSDESGLEIELVYFPPYHSKYDPIERCWGVLERHWNGTLLSSIDIA
ncbi:MAG: transposase, partial [Planctomycetaceae bacterium]